MAATAPASLLSLPAELIIKVARELDFITILRCMTASLASQVVCKLLYNLITSTTSIRYIVELGALGYVDGPPGDVPTSQRLIRLLKHGKAWRNLSWMRSHEYSTPISDHFSLYDLSGGIFARGSRTKISFFELPSHIKETDGREFKLSFEFALGDLSIDPQQDLLVLVEPRVLSSHLDRNPPFRVHLRSLSTNMPHPLASVPILQERVTPFVAADYTFFIQIMGDAIGLFVNEFDHPSLLVVWNWTTGFTKLRMQFPGLTAPHTFSFLSPTMIALPRFDEHMPGQPVRISKIDIYTMHSDSSHPSYPEPIRVASFLLPPIKSSCRVIQFRSRSDPSPGPPPHTSTVSQAQAVQVPFHISPQDRIFCFHMLLQYGDAATWPLSVFSLAVFTHGSTLLAYDKFLSPDLPEDHPRSISWEDWGPSNTRCLQGLYHLGMNECYVYGNRVVYGEVPEAVTQRCRTVRVLDFTPHAARRSALAASEDGEEEDIVGVVESGAHAQNVEGVGSSSAGTSQSVEVPTAITTTATEEEEEEEEEEDGVHLQLEGLINAAEAYADHGFVNEGLNTFVDQILDGLEWETDSEDDEDTAWETEKPTLTVANVLSPSTIRNNTIFVDDVRSSLPYRAITKSVPHRSFSGVMLDDERIICLSSDGVFWVHTL
ncbi:hypothetical protein BOTBODRAFT_179059 [Botryobasidium botryosum FD-172 SS1]|uniref:F-box domain-containing protein n=1 Tax=Botryobasidium botryosum (strain FD-172 SS1) TaxID=930990 RepID=A0A067M1E4_BOTB1|nr:hypothetical protein BOTBODRAFT_179059 [Botryobasidium botryosum FD-172 SS1]